MSLPSLSEERLYHSLIAGENASLSLPSRALWRLTGADRVRYLNGQVSNDIARLTPGKTLYTAVLTGKGRMVGDLFVSAPVGEESLLLDAPLELREALAERFEKFLIADDALFTDRTGLDRLSHHLGSVPPSAAPGRHVQANPRFGVPGFDVWEEGAVPFLTEPIVSDAVADVLRIECGLGVWGRELDDQTLPQEALLERQGLGLSYTKGCYVGQETVARIRSIGHVNRRLVLFEQIAGPGEPVSLPAPLHREEQEAGRLTSSLFSPLRQRNLALGYVPRRFLEGDGEKEFQSGAYRYRSVPPRALALG